MNWRDAHHSINKWYANLDYISEWVLKMSPSAQQLSWYYLNTQNITT